jgi:hypothetical protein
MIFSTRKIAHGVNNFDYTAKLVAFSNVVFEVFTRIKVYVVNFFVAVLCT